MVKGNSEVVTVENVASAKIKTPVGKTLQKVYVALERAQTRLNEADKTVMTTVLGGLRKMMKVKLAKKKKPQAEKISVKDAPGSEKLKEAHLAMTAAKDMSTDKKEKARLDAIGGPLARLAKKFCTMREGERPKIRGSSVAEYACHAQGLLSELEGSAIFVNKKDKTGFSHSLKNATIFVNKLQADTEK